MNKIKGFSMLEALLVIGVLGVVLAFTIPLYMTKMKRDETVYYVDYLLSVSDALREYQYHKVTVEKVNPGTIESWPTDLEALMNDYTGTFWTPCSEAQQAQSLCKRPDRIPWTTTKLAYHVETFGNDSYAYLTVAMPPKDTPEYHLWLAPFSHLPHVEIDPSANQVRIKVQDLSMAKMYQDLLHRDGSTTLTNDWDAGGEHGIVNVKDITITNADGSQTSVAAGLTRGVGMSEHEEWVTKPACPTNLSPQIMTSFSGLVPDIVTNDFDNLGPANVGILDETASQWQLMLNYTAIRNDDGEKWILNEGSINYLTFCL